MVNERKQIKAIILNVIPDERLGGPQQRVFQVARELKEAGIKTIVVMPKGDKTFARVLNEGDIAHFQLRSFRRLPNPSNLPHVIVWFLYFFPCMFTVMRLIWKHKVDIVHVNGALNVQVALAARLAGAKLLWHLNDVRRSIFTRLVALFLAILPHKVTAASMAVERCYSLRDSAGKMEVLYPPVDVKRFLPDITRAEEHRKDFGIREGQKVVGTVGNLNPVKGYEYFLQAAKLVKQQFPQVKFLVVGKRIDTQKNYWRKLDSLSTDLQINDDIIWAGYRSDISELLNIMDIFVLSSTREAAPIVVLEAMACGKPVVATTVGGVPELVVGGETGLIVQPRNPEAIAEAVLVLLNDQAKAEWMGTRGRERAIEHFDLEICAKNHQEIYASILNTG